MADDLASALARLISANQVESATVTVVLRPAVTPPPQDTPVCIFKIGPVSPKE